MRAHAEDGATGESVVAVRAGLRSQFVIELDAPGGPDALTGLLWERGQRPTRLAAAQAANFLL
ncbi:MAG: hypothetical protein KA711_04830 [Ideonella sp. WA131b]|jgi:hypothetical protein|nr:hypothetical protein [Ideonella sp. WA131b]